jgi:hypothetical protein
MNKENVLKEDWARREPWLGKRGILYLGEKTLV